MREQDLEEAREIQHLAGEICLLLKREHATNENGNLALLSVALASLMYDGISKENVLGAIGEMWDEMLPSYEGWKKSHAN